jgi:leucyl-tRNA synthetase
VEQYEPEAIERKWQAIWDAEQAFVVANPSGEVDVDRPRSYFMEMWPYPSGSLHMGHVLVYTLGDVLSRFWRRRGVDVLHPIGFDSFGLPAENAAIREGGHPRTITERNIAQIRQVMRRLGWSLDWSREISSHEPEYYHWTQWLFLRLFEAGLAYRKEAPVKWCPKDQTVLANEQVKEGRCEWCGTEVEARILKQWFFKTTQYADALLDEMELLESWQERILTIQRNWIGRSAGAEVDFRIEELDVDVPVFTTRPDTLFGATFFVLAPEHPLIGELAARSPHGDAIAEYARRAAAKRAEERAAGDKSGVFTGFEVINPVNGARLPVWVADYVLIDYGTGAVMAVPAHDERDFEFAQTFGLPVTQVVAPPGGEPQAEGAFVAHTESELLVNSGPFSGLSAPDGAKAIVEWLAEQGRGRFTVSYRLRDWLISRQRYWGCPIPIVHCGSCGEVPVPEDELPVPLPEVESYQPRGRSPLATAEAWLRVSCPRCGGPAEREIDTMDTFVDSSWYFLRYCDPHNDAEAWDRGIIDYWNPVNQYIGGVDHATMHLIYARFFVKALNDLGLVGFREPFLRLFSNGWVQLGGSKMSKSRGNILGPDELVERYGADAVRLYILFIGPADQDMDWTEEGIEGMVRFVRRLWRLAHDVSGREPVAEVGDTPLARKAHATIAKVTDDIGRRQQFNTPIAAVMELANEISRSPDDPAAHEAMETAVSLLNPYAPHVTEELWERLGHADRLWRVPWPEADAALLERDTFELVVQVNGKVRDRVTVATGLSDDELVDRAKALPRIQAQVDGRDIRRAVIVPGKLVNLVV